MTPFLSDLDTILAVFPPGVIDTDPIEVADALWLARYLPRAEPAVEDRGLSAHGEEDVPGRGNAEHGPKAWLSLPDASTAETLQDTSRLPVSEAMAGGGQGSDDGEIFHDGTRDGFTVQVPYGPALPSQHLYLKALGDFRIAVRSGPPTELDVEATIRDTARAGYVTPRMRPPKHPGMSALCILDVSRSMVIWQRAGREFVRTLAGAGIFREVDIVCVDQDGPASGPVRRAVTGGMQVAFLISDGVGGPWCRPDFPDQLASWARGGPLAVLNPLPEHLWNRTALRPAYGNIRALSPAPANARMTVQTYDPQRPSDLDEPGRAQSGHDLYIPLPVLEFTPGQLAAWAGFVRQPSAGGFDCALAAPARTRVPGPGDRLPDWQEGPGEPSPADPELATARFLASASTTAVRLAEHLSQLDGWMNLAIMRYVQDFAVPGSGPTPLAEVLLGGVMVEMPNGPRDPENRSFRFHETARAMLNRNLPFESSDRILKFIAGRIARAYNTATPGDGFAAQAVIGAAAAPGVRGDAPFAAADLILARKLRTPGTEGSGPEPDPQSEAGLLTARADGAHARFLRSGRMEDLDDAIGNRATAVACAQHHIRADMALRLARELEYRWLYSRDPRDLARARQYQPTVPAAASDDIPVSTPLGNPELPTDVRRARALVRGLENDPESREKPIELALFRFTLAVALSGSANDPEHDYAAAAEAINLFQETLNMVTENDAPLASWNRTAATRAVELARMAGRPESLDWAVRLLRTSARQAPSGDAEGTTLLAALGSALRSRYGARHEPADLAEAVLHLRTVTARQTGASGALPEDERALCLIELGRAFEDRYELDRRLSDLGEAAQSYRDAAGVALPTRPDLHAESLVAWGCVLYRQGKDDEARNRLSEGVALFERLGLGDHAAVSEARRLLAGLRR